MTRPAPRKAFPLPTPEQRAEVERLARKGTPYSDICRATGVTDKQARRICKDAGCDEDARTRQKRGAAVQWTPELEDRVAELWDEGLSTGEIAAKLGIPEQAVDGKRVNLGLSRLTLREVRMLQRPDGKHRAAAIARLGLEPDEAARFPRRVALVAQAIAWRQQA